jgi:phenylacetic acid degradation operon negative regulatory protein
MPKKELTKTSKLLLWMCVGIDVLGDFLITPYELKRRALRGEFFKSSSNATSFLHYLLRNGYIRYVDKNNERFLRITKKGGLEILLAKAKIRKSENWDGKWRVIIFDIPEDSHTERDRFRRMLKNFNYRQLQASVFISPHALNREAVRYLKDTGLMNYIRFLKVEEMDDDSDLRKLFNLPKKR